MGEPSKNTSSSSIEVDDYECPPTPEFMPPGSKTPPPTSSSSGSRRKKGTKRRSKSLDGRSSPDCDEKTCPICLGDIDNKSMTDTCLHKFCFTCLLEWSKAGLNILQKIGSLISSKMKMKTLSSSYSN